MFMDDIKIQTDEELLNGKNSIESILEKYNKIGQKESCINFIKALYSKGVIYKFSNI